jgi:Domain of unknown function (DUF4326)
MMPNRIQLRRTKGWRMPPDTVKVDRSTRFGNPFKVGDDGVPDAATAVRLFEKLLQRTDIGGSDEFFIFTPERLRQDLGAMNLACWCPLDQPCHADVLLRIANSPQTQTERDP